MEKYTPEEKSVMILKEVLSSIQSNAKDTENIAYVPDYGFITYNKVKECIDILEKSLNDYLTVKEFIKELHEIKERMNENEQTS